ncbi:MAG: HAD hydrolase family protein [Clostridiales bacterium]|nr:HAD hydrolase family protein [Clostridiales bacterium]
MSAEFSNIKCIAFDLDFTILNNTRELSPRTVDVLERARNAGIALLPVSGRPYASFPDCIHDLPGVDYAVTSNGAVVYDVHTDKRLYQRLLKAADVRAIMGGLGHFFMEGTVTYEAIVEGVAYAARDYVADPSPFCGGNPKAIEYIRETRSPVPYIIDFIYDHAAGLDAMDVIIKDTGMHHMIESTVRRKAKEVYITATVPVCMEISHEKCGKGNGLMAALEIMGIAPEETIAFGDGDNDAALLSAAGIGVAMANALPVCREAADYVTELTSDKDGVADFLEKYIL